MNCDRCFKPATPKTIKAKTGKTYDGFECTSGCKNQTNPKYSYFFFAPKGEGSQKVDSMAGADLMSEIRVIRLALQETQKTLKAMLAKMSSNSEPGEIQTQDRDEIPF